MRTERRPVLLAAILWLLGSQCIAPSEVRAQAPERTPRAASPPVAPRTAARATNAPRSRAATTLPVRRVVLYKSGVGYFEHIGRVLGDQTVSIDLTSGQLDDVLKSLTTADLGDGRVTGITYNSTAPLEHRLQTLGLGIGASTTPLELLIALRGTRIDIESGGVTTTGRVLGTQTRRRAEDVDVDEVTVVTDAGSMRTFVVDPSLRVRLAEPDVRGEVAQYLDLIASTRAQERRRLQLHTTGAGTRDLLVSYVSEVPVWKSTYRLVIPSAEGRSPSLQGWAVVDNTLGQDWTNVELSLVAGAPQSFIQQISQPLYTRRPVVPLLNTAMLTPQSHEGALLFKTGGSKGVAVEGGAGGGVPGGALGGVVGGIPSAAPPIRDEARSGPIAAVEVPVMQRRRAATAVAEGADLGELFEYKVTEPITIGRNQSALVPIVQADVTIERVSLWSSARALRRPLRAVWLTNDSALTLDGGSVSLIEAGAFAGEGVIDPIQPKEKRLISYADDLAGRVSVDVDGGPRRVSRMRVVRGALIQVVQERGTSTYTIRNEDGAPRTFVIEHARRSGWELAGGAVPPAESTASAHRFRLVVAGRTTQTLEVDEVRELESRVAVTTITSEQLAVVLSGRGLDATVEPQLRAVMAQNATVARIVIGLRDHRAEIERIEKDQARVRENMSALKSSAEERQLIARYAAQFQTQEDRLARLRHEIEEMELHRGAAQDVLVQLAHAVTFDVTMP